MDLLTLGYPFSQYKCKDSKWGFVLGFSVENIFEKFDVAMFEICPLQRINNHICQCSQPKTVALLALIKFLHLYVCFVQDIAWLFGFKSDLLCLPSVSFYYSPQMTFASIHHACSSSSSSSSCFLSGYLECH